jgi:hypothetical protein
MNNTSSPAAHLPPPAGDGFADRFAAVHLGEAAGSRSGAVRAVEDRWDQDRISRQNMKENAECLT